LEYVKKLPQYSVFFFHSSALAGLVHRFGTNMARA